MDLNLSSPEQIQQLINALQALLPKNETDNKKISKNKNNIKTKKTKSGKKNDEDYENKFLSMPEMNMHKSDTKIDKKLAQQPPTPRNRPFRYIDVTCRSCGKKEKVNPKILPESADRYKCNNCSTNAGA